jgi:hypothetical protein
MQAVGNETRLSKGTKSTMIDDNRELFDKVSRQNIKRAEQMRTQFTEKRKLMHTKLNDKHKDNRIKLSQF